MAVDVQCAEWLLERETEIAKILREWCTHTHTHQSDEPVEDKHHGGIVGAIVERRQSVVLKVAVPLLKLRQSGRI